MDALPILEKNEISYKSKNTPTNNKSGSNNNVDPGIPAKKSVEDTVVSTENNVNIEAGEKFEINWYNFIGS